ncbi:MAG: phospho-sugar mutase [Acidimicrobiia bacterium]|nr:phospho-sugar mutase [Acidimicrobiia bacterium]
MDVRNRALDWIAGDPDPTTRDELRALVDAGNDSLLAERMAGPHRFGTAGIRGAVEAGDARMNRATIIRATAGLADSLAERFGSGLVVVGFDARLSSERFAQDTIGVLLAAGFTVRYFVEPTPTPIVAYAGKIYDAVATVIVTASHNPPKDNGYKVYDANAAQIVPPIDTHIADAIDRVGAANEVPRTEVDLHGPPEGAAAIGPELLEAYWADVAAERPVVHGAPVRIVTTPLHGVGGAPVVDVLGRGGHTDVHPVPEQFIPDGHFPTVSFPNPEEPGALDLATALASEIGADVVLANDPDVDRLAVSLPTADGWRNLTGNQIGVLLADHVLSHWDRPERPMVANSIVSSPMLFDVASAYGAHCEQTLTGFKWICNAALDLERDEGLRFAMGFEEAIGYSVGPVVRDKDGISAALVFADLVGAAKADGRTAWDLLADLATRHGLWVSAQYSVVRPGTEGAAEIAAAMARLATEQPGELVGKAVTGSLDYREGADSRPRWLTSTPLVALTIDGGRVLIRPSGTEPKLKIYVDLRAPFDAGGDFLDQEAARTEEAAEIAAAMGAWLGF